MTWCKTGCWKTCHVSPLRVEGNKQEPLVVASMQQMFVVWLAEPQESLTETQVWVERMKESVDIQENAQSKDGWILEADVGERRLRATICRVGPACREKLSGIADLQGEKNPAVTILRHGGWSVCTHVLMWLCSEARLWHKPCAVPRSPPSHCAPLLPRLYFSANKNKITHKINGNNLLLNRISCSLIKSLTVG